MNCITAIIKKSYLQIICFFDIVREPVTVYYFKLFIIYTTEY